MDNASDYGSEDCRFESCWDRHYLFALNTKTACLKISTKNIFAPPGGLEPPTFRLTAERASRLRHGGKLEQGGEKTIFDIEL